MSTDDFLNEMERALHPLLTSMIGDYQVTALRCDWAYYALMGLTITVTALIPAFSASNRALPWVVPSLGIIAAIATGLQGLFRFDQRGRQWTGMLIEFEGLHANWLVFKASVRCSPLDEVREGITAEVRRIVEKVLELERKDTASFYKDISKKAAG